MIGKDAVKPKKSVIKDDPILGVLRGQLQGQNLPKEWVNNNDWMMSTTAGVYASQAPTGSIAYAGNSLGM